MVRATGAATAAAVYDTSLLPHGPGRAHGRGRVRRLHRRDVKRIYADEVGLVSMHLGGGRATKESVIDLSVGVVLAAKDGAYLHAGDTLATIHAKTEADAAAAEEELLKCYTFSDEAPVRPPFIRGVVT